MLVLGDSITQDGRYVTFLEYYLHRFAPGAKCDLISQVRASGARLVLFTPPCFDPRPLSDRTVSAEAAAFGYPHPYVGYDRVLAEFAAAELALAAPDVKVIDVHSVMAEALAQGTAADSAFIFSPDGVHPNDLGHLLMARVAARLQGEIEILAAR